MLGLIAGAVTGLLGLGASAVGAVGSSAIGLAGLGASAIGGAASGIGSMLFGGPAAGATAGQQMAAMAQPAYYEAAAGTVGQQLAAIAQPAYYETAGAGILGGVASAASSTIGYLGDLVPAATGLFQVIKPSEQKVAPQVSGAVPSVTTPGITAPAITEPPLPIFGQQPAVMTVGTAAGPKEVNYMLYIGLALLAFLLLRKK